MSKKLQDKNVIKVIIFAVVLLIPVIYSFFYLKAYWNPYDNLSDIKVGIVNLDIGIDGENRGEELRCELKKSGTFNFIDVNDMEEANKALGNDEYYAVIAIPNNFTETLKSAATENKQVSTITYMPNKRKNYLASQILNSALKTIELNLESKISKEVTATLSDSLKDVPENLGKIADGSKKINNGANELDAGLNSLSEGIQTLNKKYAEFDNGIGDAHKGSESLVDGISKVGTGIDSLANGADTLSNAISQVNIGAEKLEKDGGEGIEKITSGIDSLNDGAIKLNEGINQYVEGAENLAQGINQYVEGVEQVSNGIIPYVDSVEGLALGTSSYVSGMSDLNSKKNNLLQAIIEASKTNPELAAIANQAQGILDYENTSEISSKGSELKTGADKLINKDETGLSIGQKIKYGASLLVKPDETGISSSQKLRAGANQLLNDSGDGLTAGEKVKNGANILVGGISTLKNGASGLFEITNGMNTLKSALSQIDNGTISLQDGVGALKNGNTVVENGAITLVQGIETLDESSSKIESALNKLNDGARSAVNGSKTLKDGTKEFELQIESGLKTAKEEIEKLDGLDEYVQNPVNIEEKSYGEVDSYGVAFAPLFISIGLWVGVLMCYVVLYYDQRHRFGIFDSETKFSKILQNFIYLAIGAIEGILTGMILKAGLGLDVQNTMVYIAQCALTGTVFMAIIQFLIRNFGDVGKFIALIILVLQLAASGGTFPVETIDNGFRGFTSFLPMTYTIRALRDALVTTDNSLIATNTWILVTILIVVILLGFICELIRNKFSKENKKNFE